MLARDPTAADPPLSASSVLSAMPYMRQLASATTPEVARAHRQLKAVPDSAGNGPVDLRDYLGETTDGSQIPMLNVFHRDGETIRHFWGAEVTYAPADPGQDHRSVGTLEPLWNLFDLTAEGRPTDSDEQLSY